MILGRSKFTSWTQDLLSLLVQRSNNYSIVWIFYTHFIQQLPISNFPNSKLFLFLSSFLNSRVLKFIDIAYKCHENTGWLGIWLFSDHCRFAHSLTPFLSLALPPKFPPNLYKLFWLQVIKYWSSSRKWSHEFLVYSTTRILKAKVSVAKKQQCYCTWNLESRFLKDYFPQKI